MAFKKAVVTKMVRSRKPDGTLHTVMFDVDIFDDVEVAPLQTNYIVNGSELVALSNIVDLTEQGVAARKLLRPQIKADYENWMERLKEEKIVQVPNEELDSTTILAAFGVNDMLELDEPIVTVVSTPKNTKTTTPTSANQ